MGYQSRPNQLFAFYKAHSGINTIVPMPMELEAAHSTLRNSCNMQHVSTIHWDLLVPAGQWLAENEVLQSWRIKERWFNHSYQDWIESFVLIVTGILTTIVLYMQRNTYKAQNRLFSQKSDLRNATTACLPRTANLKINFLASIKGRKVTRSEVSE